MASETQPQTESAISAELTEPKPSNSQTFDGQQARRRPMRSTAMPAGARQHPSRMCGMQRARGEDSPRKDLGKRGMMRMQMTDENQKYCPVNQLKHIALDKNGTFMTDFDPEKSKREMRKLNRKIHKENKKQNQMYDEKGRLLENSKDICDCLDLDCPGCHFPCPRCTSEKCGSECRAERRWIYEQIEVEGTNLTLKWTLTKLA